MKELMLRLQSVKDTLQNSHTCSQSTMKVHRLVMLITLLVMGMGQMWGETTLFSMKPTTASGSLTKDNNYDVSSYGTVSGGSAKFYITGSSNRTCVTGTTDTPATYFDLPKGTYYELSLTNYTLEEGDVIHISTYGSGTSRTFYLNNSASTSSAIQITGTKQGTIEQTYTVTANDVLKGKSTIYLISSGQDQYFNSFSIIRTPTAHTLTFNAGSYGTCSTTSLTEESVGAGVTLPSATANDGYAFVGWFNSSNIRMGGAGETYMPSADETLTAHYAAISGTCIGAASGNVGFDTQKSPAVNINSGDTWKFKFNSYGRPTYSSSGFGNAWYNWVFVAGNYYCRADNFSWISGNNGSQGAQTGDWVGYMTALENGAPVEIVAKYTGSAMEVTGTTTYNNNTYTVSYKSSDNTGTLTTDDALSAYVSLENAYLTNYSAALMPTIIFNANADDATGTMDAQVIDNNVATALNANTFKRSGYTFAGWATSADGEVAYADKGSVTLTANTPLYAKWTETTLSSIAVKTSPTKTTYTEGDKFDPTGLVITKTMTDESTTDVAYADEAANFTFDPSTSTGLTTSNTSITITYGDKTTTQNITVNEKETGVETLFYRDFTDSNWGNATFTDKTNVNYDVTTSISNTEKQFSWSSDGLSVCANNISTNSNFAAIPVSKVNGTLTVTIKTTGASLGYGIDAESEIGTPSNVSEDKLSSKGSDGLYTHVLSLTDQTATDFVIYLGRKSNDAIWKTILITTPSPVTAAPTDVSVSPTDEQKVATGNSITLTASSANGYSYKWYESTTAGTSDGTEIYGETMCTLNVSPTEAGTKYYYCKAVNSLGETVSTYATVTSVVTPTITFNVSSTSYNASSGKWTGTAPKITVTPASLLGNVTYTCSNTGVTYSADSEGNGSLAISNNAQGEMTITATLKTSGVEGVEDGTFTASLDLTVADGYASPALSGTPSVGSTVDITDDDNNVVLTMKFGGWTHGSSSNPNTWEASAADGGATDGTDSWGKASDYSSGTAIDGFSKQSQANCDSRSETKGLIEWTTEYSKINPFSLPCRGAYISVEPKSNGTLTIYLVQNGCIAESDGDKLSDSPRVYYWFDECGNVIPSTPTLNQSINYLAASYKDDLLAKWGVALDEEGESASNYNEELTQMIKEYWGKKTSTTDNESAIPYRNGYLIIKKAYIKYVINVLAGKTYYFFSNGSKMGYAGMNFAPKDVTISKSDGSSNETVKTSDALTLSQITDFTVPTTTTAYKTITLDRSFTANTWNTICLPFSVSEEQVKSIFGDDTQLIIYDGCTGSTANFKYHVYQDIIAGQPYFIKTTKTITSETFSNVTINSNAAVKNNGSNGDDGNFTFTGVFNTTTLNAYDHVISSKGGIGYYTKAVTLKGYRAYLKNNTVTSHNPAKISAISLSNAFNDANEETDATGIMQILADEGVVFEPANGIYNINGQKVANSTANLPAGLYIINGKKITIK